MPDEQNSSAIAIASRKRCERAAKLGLPLPSPQWGRFQQLTAIKAIRATLRLNAQHVALILACETPPDGVIVITHKHLHEITGRAAETVADALKEAEEKGLLYGKRTLGTFVYVWGERVFPGYAQEQRKGFFAFAGFVDEHAPSEAELDACNVSEYREAFAARYGFECGEVQLDAKGLARIRGRITWLAHKRRRQDESIGNVYRRTAREFFRAWLAFDGHGDDKWLVARYHPIQALADGQRYAQDADLNVATNAVIVADKNAAKRAAKEIELVRHVPGPEGRRAITPTKAPFAYALPQSVRAELAVQS